MQHRGLHHTTNLQNRLTGVHILLHATTKHAAQCYTHLACVAVSLKRIGRAYTTSETRTRHHSQGRVDDHQRRTTRQGVAARSPPPPETKLQMKGAEAMSSAGRAAKQRAMPTAAHERTLHAVAPPHPARRLAAPASIPARAQSAPRASHPVTPPPCARCAIGQSRDQEARAGRRSGTAQRMSSITCLRKARPSIKPPLDRQHVSGLRVFLS